MIKILTIIGARPQIIKASALSRAIKKSFNTQIKEILVHTGQHYDANMSQVFFDEMGIPKEDYNLEIHEKTHGLQTAKMLESIEQLILTENPDFVVVYGDTNSTLAGALAASKVHIPVVHIEAGLRSFNKNMPEEINRIMSDHVSTLLFSPTQTGLKNLINEGFKTDALPPYSASNPKVYHCGDVMYDNSLYFSEIAEKKSTLLSKLNLQKNKYVLATIHRPANTDNPEKLSAIFEAMQEISSQAPIVLPLHPRTKNCMEQSLSSELLNKIQNNNSIKIIPPVSFFDMIALEKSALLFATDSGGVQKESHFFKKPCLILRPETEWIELVHNKTAVITDTDKNKIIDSFNWFINHKDKLVFSEIFGDGHAAEFICKQLLNIKNQ